MPQDRPTLMYDVVHGTTLSYWMDALDSCRCGFERTTVPEGHHHQERGHSAKAALCYRSPKAISQPSHMCTVPPW